MSTPTTTGPGNLTSRLPNPSMFIPEFVEIAGVLYKATANGSIPRTTVNLVHLRAAQIIGNTYHAIRPIGDLRKAGETEERITSVATWRDVPYFTDAERIALELLEAVLIPNPLGERVPDELCARASAHYDHKALWMLIMAIGQMCFFIPVALIGKPVPGTEQRWKPSD